MIRKTLFALSIGALSLTPVIENNYTLNHKQEISFKDMNLKLKSYSPWNDSKGILTVDDNKESTYQLYWVNGQQLTKMTDYYMNKKTAVNPTVLMSWNNNYAIFSALYKSNIVPNWYIIDKSQNIININSLQGLQNVNITNAIIINEKTCIIFDSYYGYLINENNDEFTVTKINQRNDDQSIAVLNNNIISFGKKNVSTTTVSFYNINTNKVIKQITLKGYNNVQEANLFSDNNGIITLVNGEAYSFKIANSKISLNKLTLSGIESIYKLNNNLMIATTLTDSIESTYTINDQNQINILANGSFKPIKDNLGFFRSPSGYQLISQNTTTKQFDFITLKYNNKRIMEIYFKILNDTTIFATIGTGVDRYKALLISEQSIITDLNKIGYDIGHVNNNLSIFVDKNNNGEWIINS